MPPSDARPVGGAQAVMRTASSVLAEMERRWLTPQDVVSIASRLGRVDPAARVAYSVPGLRSASSTALLDAPKAERRPPDPAAIDIVRRDTPILPETPPSASVAVREAPASEQARNAVAEDRPKVRTASPPVAPVAEMVPPVPEVPIPAVDPAESISWAFITCLEDGRKVRDLARHLRDKFEMKPDEYRAKWNLPKAYPMRAPQEILSKAFVAEYDPIRRTFTANRSTS